MLAYDERYRLKEFEEKQGLEVCDSCHRIYRQMVCEQVPGFREKESDCCPYCGYDNGSSMSYEYYNSMLTQEELSKLPKKSLISRVVRHCNDEYLTLECDDCVHIGGCPGECEGNCKNCLEEVHYPGRHPKGKKDYDCNKMLDFYVCDYSAKYSSEILYLMRESEALKQIEDYHVLSIGCGGCPDLMAFEKYCHQNSYDKSVSYIGIDVNEKWKPIHEVIKSYKTGTLRKTQFIYMDAVTEDCNIEKVNVIVLQYVISHFYNTGQIGKIDDFFKKLVENFISHKQQGKPLVVLINDVNSNNRGRDYFQHINEILDAAGFKKNSKSFYFDYNIQNDFQRYGTRHKSTDILYKLPSYLDIYQPWEKCSSAQLLIEVL